MSDINRIKRISIVRDSIEGIVCMLSGKKIRVVQAGNKAQVEYDKRGNAKVVYLPVLNENTSNKMLDAIQGFLDHEVAHILFTDPAILKEAGERKVKTVHNIIEDTYIEAQMAKEFRGSESNLERMRQIFTKDYIDKDLKALKDNPLSTEMDYWGLLIACACRAWAGQTYFEEYMEDKWNHIGAIANKLKGIDKDIQQAESSKDCLDVALKMKKILQFDDESETEDNDKSEGESKESESEEKQESDESENEEGDSEEGGSEEGGSEEGDSEEGDSEGEGSGDPDYDGEEYQQDSDSTEEVRSNPFLQPEGPPPKFNEDDFDNVKGFDDALAEMISEFANMELDRTDYLPFSTDWDHVAPLEVHSDVSKLIREMQESLDGHIRKITRDMEKMFLANNRSRWERGKSSGRLNSTSLARLASNDARVFKSLKEVKTKEVAVSLLIDCSGSMSGDKIKLATEVAWAMAEVLDKLKIKNEVIGFTDDYYENNPNTAIIKRQFESLSWSEQKKFTRDRAIYMPILKSFDERFTLETKRRMAFLGASRMRMGANVDGESLVIAAQRLLKQQESGKTIIVLSDGQPAVSGCDIRLSYKHLKDSINALKKGDVNCIGIGIQSASVSEFYPKNVIVNNLEELPTQVMKELSRVILQK